MSGAQAQAALDGSRKKLVADGTGRFVQVISFGPGGSIARQTITGSYNVPRKIWKTTMEAKEAGKPASGSIIVIGTTAAAYLTSPQWPARIRGRWYRYSASDLTQATSGPLTLGLSEGLPDAVSSLTEIRARSGAAFSSFQRVEADLPASNAVSLAGLKAGLAKFDVDAATLTGKVPITVELSPDGRVHGLTMAAGALKKLGNQLPANLTQLSDVTAFEVTFEGFGAPVSILVPTGRQIVPQSEMQ